MPPCERRPRVVARPVRFVLIILAFATVGAVHTTGAGAVQAGESISSYDVTIDVRPSGVIHVREVLAYDLGATPRHGIVREVPVRYHYDGRYDRIYRIQHVSVAADPGTPTNLKLSDRSGRKVMRIGDPKRTITGSHRYTIDYDVDGALNGFPEHDELNWNAIGTEWSVPIGRPTVLVTTPAAATAVACFAGPFRSDSPCTSPATEGSTQSRFANDDLGPEEAFTVVVSLPKGAVARTGPILDERWSPVRAFAVTPGTVAASLALLLFGVGSVGWLLWRNGRDRRLAGGSLEPVPGPGAAEEMVPLFTDRDGPVVYRPPDGLRPAELGVLVDERADPVDVTATIVDLAVRGYLAIEAIEDVERKRFWNKPDWRLVQKKPADGDLLRYERDLLESIFRGRTEVKLSELRNTFHSDLQRIEGELYDDAVARGWFVKRPDRVRNRWLVLGILLAVLGAGAVAAAAATTHAGLVPVPIVFTGLLLAVGHRWMPARTPKGSAALTQALGFRRYIETAETDRMRFAEQENLWATYLPYAVVFGATRKWARAFEGLGAEQQAAVGSWYVSPYPFSADSFSDSLESFTHTTAGAIVSTPSSSASSGFGGGGFSGGGGGGGGGGSW